jgi:hypothetical protein
VQEYDSSDSLVIRVKDNGKGMSEELLKTVENPFVTTRLTRKTGLGISFLKEAAEMTGGSVSLESKPGEGTTVTAHFVKSHIDRQPIGNLTATVITLVSLNPGVEFILRYQVNENEFAFATQEAKELLGGDTGLNSPAIVSFLTEYLQEHIENLSGGPF